MYFSKLIPVVSSRNQHTHNTSMHGHVRSYFLICIQYTLWFFFMPLTYVCTCIVCVVHKFSCSHLLYFVTSNREAMLLHTTMQRYVLKIRIMYYLLLVLHVHRTLSHAPMHTV